MRVLLNTRGGGFVDIGSAGVGPAPESVVIADFDGDRSPDLAVANAMADTVTVLRRKACAP